MTILLAVSGGIDSIYMAHRAPELWPGASFAVAHCNFNLRSDESDGDEAFVREWCALRGLPLHVRSFQTRQYAAAMGISIEMAARELRYAWFGELCTGCGYDAVAVAHNAGDNAETLLLNLLRGTGLRGITGMRAEGFLPNPGYSGIPLLRPLLGITRAEIEAYAREHALSWREDSTNALCDYKRNKLRNQVFPIFEEINPRFVEALNRDMVRFADELSSARWEVAPPQPLESDPAAEAASVAFSVSEEPWDGSQSVKQPAGMLIMDADKVGGKLLEGRWLSGDWIHPLGAPGRKKMQDWFTDHHIPAWEKSLIPLLKSSDDPQHVLAVVGHCIDHSVRVTASTRRILRITSLPGE